MLPCEGEGKEAGEVGDAGDVGCVGDATFGRTPPPCFDLFAAFTLCFVGGGGSAWGIGPLGVGLETGASNNMGWGENSLKSGDKGADDSDGVLFWAGCGEGFWAKGSKVISWLVSFCGAEFWVGEPDVVERPPKPPKRSNSSVIDWPRLTYKNNRLVRKTSELGPTPSLMAQMASKQPLVWLTSKIEINCKSKII